MTMKVAHAASMVFGLMVASVANAATPIEVPVTGPRIHVSDVVAGADAQAGAVDLGPVPAPFGSRIIPRAEIVAALRDSGAPTPKKLPDAVRVVRKMTQLSASDVERALRDAIAKAKMPRGATLAAVQAPRVLAVPEGWTRAAVDLPRPPRRSGTFTTTAMLTFLREDEVLTRANVPVELTLSAEAATFDVAKGSNVMLVIRRGLVEISVPATAGADADIGARFPILLRPSGRVVQARLVDKDHAESLEGS
jgi:hypothetical protein